ncbi:MAG: hypothetical protein ACKERG_01145 [Candidatus Hodgkinia cicadicola]
MLRFECVCEPFTAQFGNQLLLITSVARLEVWTEAAHKASSW